MHEVTNPEEILSETSVQYVGKSKVTMGRFTYGKFKLRQWGEGASLTLGSYCSIANDVLILLGGEHRLDRMTTFPFGEVYKETFAGDFGLASTSKGDVVIGSDVWLGTQATITSGVTIGDGAVVAANSLVNKNVEPYQIVGGNPARPIRYRFEPPIVERLLKLRWWDLPVEDVKSMIPTLAQRPTIQSIDELIARYRSG